MLLARHARVVELVVGWGSAGGSVIAFYRDATAPHTGFSGRLAIGLAILTASIYLGVKISKAVVSLRACVDSSIGAAAQFGRESERRRLEDRAELATVRPITQGTSRGKR